MYLITVISPVIGPVIIKYKGREIEAVRLAIQLNACDLKYLRISTNSISNSLL